MMAFLVIIADSGLNSPTAAAHITRMSASAHVLMVETRSPNRPYDADDFVIDDFVRPDAPVLSRRARWLDAVDVHDEHAHRKVIAPVLPAQQVVVPSSWLGALIAKRHQSIYGE